MGAASGGRLTFWLVTLAVLMASGAAGPASLAGWASWAFWQFTSGATVPGIGSAGNTDVSEADASRLTLLAPGTRPGATGAAVPTPFAGASG